MMFLCCSVQDQIWFLAGIRSNDAVHADVIDDIGRRGRSREVDIGSIDDFGNFRTGKGECSRKRRTRDRR